MTSVAPAAERIHLGMDVSRERCGRGVAAGEDVPVVELISPTGRAFAV